MHRFGVLLAAVGGALAFTTAAYAHAEISPAVALSGTGQLFTLAVPTEKEDVTTTKIELSPPDGFEIDSYVDAPGWQRDANANGDVAWSGGSVPTDEDAVFQFIASADSAKTYAFTVRQTYSDGTVVDWTGPESSDTPAPQVELKSSFGGGSDTLAIVALVLGAIALVVAIAGLLTSAGRRSVA